MVTCNLYKLFKHVVIKTESRRTIMAMSDELNEELEMLKNAVREKEAEVAKAVQVESVLTMEQLLAAKIHENNCNDYHESSHCNWYYHKNDTPGIWDEKFTVREKYLLIAEQVLANFPSMTDDEVILISKILKG
jgi:hypothetical protein